MTEVKRTLCGQIWPLKHICPFFAVSSQQRGHSLVTGFYFVAGHVLEAIAFKLFL